jgi:hypothetical protein
VDATLTLVWGLVLANVIGGTLCFLFVSQIARISMLKVHRIFPVLMVIIFLGAFQGRQGLGDLVVLFVMGLLGWVMKRGGWPRPALMLGFILGEKIQDTLFLSIERYGASWILEPLPLFLGALCVLSIVFGAFYQPGQGRRPRTPWSVRPEWSPRPVLTVILLAAVAFMSLEAGKWVYQANLFPLAIAVPTLGVLAFQLCHDLFARPPAGVTAEYADIRPDAVDDHRTFIRQVFAIFGWLVGLLAGVIILGLPIAMTAFVFGYLVFRSGEKWWVAAIVAAILNALLFLFFDRVLNVLWPEGLLGGG